MQLQFGDDFTSQLANLFDYLLGYTQSMNETLWDTITALELCNTIKKCRLSKGKQLLWAIGLWVSSKCS